MSPEIAALAAAAGTTLVRLLTTESWQQLKNGLVALWRRVHPERAETVAGDLDATRDDLLRAQAGGDEQSEDELRAEWRGRIRRLLVAHPEAADDLRRLLNEFGAELPPTITITQHASASDQARIYQAGRDMFTDRR